MTDEPQVAGQEAADPPKLDRLALQALAIEWLNEHGDEWRETEELAWSIRALGPQRSAQPQVPDAEGRIPVGIYSIHPSAEMMTLAVAVAIFGKAYMETLGKRAGEGTAGLPKKVRDLVRARIRKEDAPDEILLGPKNGKAATIVFTQDLPDEARLALLDLDVTALELRGRELRWNEAAGEWRPSEATSTD